MSVVITLYVTLLYADADIRHYASHTLLMPRRAYDDVASAIAAAIDMLRHDAAATDDALRFDYGCRCHFATPCRWFIFFRCHATLIAAADAFRVSLRVADADAD